MSTGEKIPDEMYDKFFEGGNVALLSAALRTDLIACH